MFEERTCQFQLDQDDHRMYHKQFHFLLDLIINNHNLFFSINLIYIYFYLQFCSKELKLLEHQELQLHIIPMISKIYNNFIDLNIILL